MIQEKINLSIILTVFNKENYINAVYESYASQLESNYEIIFIDDNSTDNSKSLLKDLEKKNPRVKVIVNNINKGPSVRLNQGIAIARGDYILLTDGDDVCRKNALSPLITIMAKNNVKFLFAPYGGHRKIFNSHLDLPDYPNSIDSFKIVENPLRHVIKKRQIGMGILIQKDILPKTKLCDERIFVQDISLHLNLAKNANRLIIANEPFLFGFNDNSSSLSKSNFGQGIHDIILTYYFFLLDNKDSISIELQNIIINKASTAIFKYYRKYSNPPILDYLKVCLFFIQGRLRLYSNHLNYLKKLVITFRKNNTVRVQANLHE